MMLSDIRPGMLVKWTGVDIDGLLWAPHVIFIVSVKRENAAASTVQSLHFSKDKNLAGRLIKHVLFSTDIIEFIQ